MTKKAPRPPTDLRLKIAILESGRSQRRVSIDTRIGEVRLSKIIRGLEPPTAVEQARLAKYLGRRIADLFAVPNAGARRPEGSGQPQGTV
jgi:transcriptional regulator with XRE-family HTH domain